MPTRIGLDVGSVSVKLAAILGLREARSLVAPLAKTSTFRFASESTDKLRASGIGPIVVSECRRSLGNPFQATMDLLHEFQMLLADSDQFVLSVTGSGGHHVAEALNLPSENEFKAIARGVSALYPQIRTVLEMGGENSKYILLDGFRSRDSDESGNTCCRSAGILDYAMSSQCAAGTGSFIDQQASRLQCRVEDIGAVVLKANSTARIAGRCSVFAKSDMIHAQQKGYSTPEVLKGLCEAVSRNFKSNIVKGRKVVAPVAFGGGCTGEIVSPQGLILTNHHCGYGSIQQHSTVEHDYLRDGFWAKSREEELPTPNLTVTFLIKIEDVTSQVLAGVKEEMKESDRSAVISDARQKIERSAGEGNNYRTVVASFYGGNYFYLLVYERYNDVRFVGAPPSSIGKFGSDTDNWEWPRHTGDFSVFRVYTGKDGKPAAYSRDNVPLNPKYYLPVSLKDLNPGEFTMILGYPGRTSRYMTSWEVNEQLNIVHPDRIRIRGIKQEIWMKDMQADQKINIQYASKYFTSSNYWKYSIGQKRGLENLNVKAKKEEIESQFNKWIASNPDKKARYGEALNLIKTSIEGRAEPYNAQQYRFECLQGCELLSMNQGVDALITALKAGDNKKISEAVEKIRSNEERFYKDYSPPTDNKSMKAMLKLYRADVPAKYHPDFYTTVVDKKFKGNIEKFVDDMFKRSIFADQSKLDAFLNKPDLKTVESDPVYLTASSLSKTGADLARELSQFDGSLSTGKRLWIAALMDMEPEKTQYPDANSTMRLSFGSVQSYDPKDAVTYKYYTTLQGVVDKYKPGDYEFDLPQRLIDLNKKKEYGRYGSSKGYMPVCFLTTNDITGGNSGSPVMNGNGELIGLAFDGNWESMSGDIAYEPELQRTIVVDIRYVLWVMDIYAGAKNLVDEMKIVQ